MTSKTIYSCTFCHNQIKNYGKKFCSKSCSAKYNNQFRSPETISKQKESLRKMIDSIHTVPKPPKIKIPNIRICNVCGKYEESFSSRGFQSNSCLHCSKTNAYRSKCKFTFDIRKYPNEFEIHLIIEHGMFHPVKNPYGAVKDHMLSINFGKQNKIDPKIMAHPANCKILLQKDNMKKLDKSSITLEELMDRIKIWEEKYGSE